jgi:oxygen-independent coproporphyrinogen-3 oxidase
MTATSSVGPRAVQLSRLVAKYDGRAPRYTSYPTALQFTPAVGEATYRKWLRELPTEQPVSLYVHVPFCGRLCWYCGCNTRATTRHQPVAEYVALLVKEARLLESALPGRLAASAVHLGGGSPNMLSAEELAAIFEVLDQVFEPMPEREVAAELDPGGLTQAWVNAAVSHGLNRASLGVQTLDPVVQAAVNRRERYEHIADCVGWLRAAGVSSINIDLMYGLPHQTTSSVRESLEAVMRLAPDRIALFGYAHVPWMKTHQKLIDEAALPGAAERLDQSEAAADALVAEGYIRIGIDHFALPHDALARAASAGRLHRNFQGYTSDPAATLLGLGASAIGRLPEGFVQNISQEVDWRTAVGAGRLPVARGVEVTDEDAFRWEIIERLMCDMAVDLEAVCSRHGRQMAGLIPCLQRLEPFCEDGLLTAKEGKLQVLGAGRLVLRSICAQFDRHFDVAGGRHAKAL